MMGRSFFFLVLIISLSQVFAQVDTLDNSTQDSSTQPNTQLNTVVGENGLIAVLPAMDAETISVDNGLIGVVPGFDNSQLVNVAQGDAVEVVQADTSGIIAVVPSAVSQEEIAKAQAALSASVVEVESVVISEPVQVVPLEEISNVSNYVQDAIENTITDNSVLEDVAVEDVVETETEEAVVVENNVRSELAQVDNNYSVDIENTSDAVENIPDEAVVLAPEIQKVIDAAIALYPEIEANQTEVLVQTLDEATDATIDKELSVVQIEVSKRAYDSSTEAAFEVVALPVESVGDELSVTTSGLIVTDIEAVGLVLDYGESITGGRGFVKGLLEANLLTSTSTEGPEVVAEPQESTQAIEEEIITETETIEVPEEPLTETAREIESTEVSEVDIPSETQEATQPIVEEALTETVEEALTETVNEVDQSENPETEVTEESEAIVENLPIDLAELAKDTMFAGNLDLNQTISEVLATDTNQAVYHTYQINVPEGQEALTIMVDGQEGDVDLAIKAGSEIDNYYAVDFIDNSNLTVASYSYKFPPSGPIFVDVMNYSAEPIAYVLTTSDVYVESASSGVSAEATSQSVEVADTSEALETGHFFDLSLNTVLDRSIAAKEPSASMVYHSYEVALPAGLNNIQVLLDGQGHDVDMAVRLGEPIVRLSDVDFFDNSEQAGASYEFNLSALSQSEFNLAEGTILYIDVLNYLQEAAHYELQVIVDELNAVEVPIKSEIDNIRAYAPKIDTESIAHLSDDVTKLNAEQRYKGTIANYLQVDQEDAGIAASQSFLLRVPEGTKRFVVTLSANEDLDIAVKHASPIESYALKNQGGDWDYLDMRPATNSRIQVNAPEAGFWYIDVIQANSGKGAAPYTLQVFYP